jgi:hypothetical protein
MLRAAVPKTPPNLYGYAQFRENEIDVASQARKGLLTHAIAEATREKLST